MQNRQKFVSLIEKFLALRISGDSSDVVARIFTNDAVYRIVGGAKLGPYAGPFVGPQSISDVVYRLSVNFQFVDLKANLIVVEGEHACVRWSGRWENRGTGVGAWMEGIAHVILRDDKIAAYTNFFDTATVAEFAGWD